MIELSHLNKLEEFRSKLHDLNLKNEYLTKGFLYPFLKARNMDIVRAKEMLEKAIAWREEHVKLLDWTPPIGLSQSLLQYEFLGEDARGRPVLYAETGKCEMKQVLKEHGRDVYNNHYIKMIFKAYYRAKETCKDEVPKCVLLSDYKDFKMAQLMSAQVLSATKEQNTIVEEYFPGLFEEMIMVRTSGFADSFLKLVRAFMSEEPKNAMKIYSSEAEYKPILLNLLPLERIPKELGGLRK